MMDLTTLAGQRDHYAAVAMRLNPRPVALPREAVTREVLTPIDFYRTHGLRFIAEYVEVRHGVSMSTMRGKSYCRSIAHARHSAWALMYSHVPRASCERIGRLFDNQYTTVVRALQKKGII